MNLKTSVQRLLTDALQMCQSCSEADKLATELEVMKKRLDEPLRVAVVGFVKAGKSTLMNAIMKEKILFTGAIETTSIPSWFKYAPNPSISVVFKDGHKENYAFEELKKWTVKAETDKNPRAADVTYIELKYPNEVLKTMELIDTPGFGAGSSASDRAMDFFGFDSNVQQSEQDKESSRITAEFAAQADAIIYGFAKSAQAGDQEILTAFQGDTVAPNTSPINALGVLTKADVMWDVLLNNDPMETAQGVIRNLIAQPVLKSLLYTIAPVCAKIVESISELGEKEWDILQRLSKLDEELLLNILFDRNAFIEYQAGDFAAEMEKKFSPEEYRNIGNPEERQHICAICEQYGIYVITKALNDGVEPAQIIEHVYEKSGIRYLSDLVYQHFGKRSFIIKVRYMFSYLNSLAGRTMLANPSNKNLEKICEYIKEQIDDIQTTEQVFRELKVMQAYYNGQLNFKDEQEVEQFLQITGENGGNCEAKLGVPEGTPIKELDRIAKERIHYWNQRANDIPITRYYEEAAQVFSRSYGILHYHLQSLLGD